MGGCSNPSIASLGLVFEIEEDRNLSWDIAPNWLWYGFLSQGAAARCELLSSPETSLLTLSWKLTLVHPFRNRGCRPLPQSCTIEPTVFPS